MKIAIIIPNKNNNKLLFDCILSIKNNTKYENYHIYIADTGSTNEELEEIKTFLIENFKTNKNASLVCFNYYNFSKINNEIVKKHLNDEEILLFCNNDIKLIDDCVTKCFNIIKNNPDQIGTVGVKLLYGDGTIQHGGQYVILSKLNYDVVALSHRGLKEDQNNFSKREIVLGNTGGFMMTEKKLFLELGGFNERYTECFEDVEYNINCILKNKNNIYLGDVKAWHFESQSRVKNGEETKKRQQNDGVSLLVPFIKKNAKQIVDKNLIQLM
jgi:GT2 family glycosyltransferase